MEQAIFMATIFGTVAMAVIGAGMLMRDKGVDRRLSGVRPPQTTASVRYEGGGFLKRLAMSVGLSKRDPGSLGSLRQTLIQAGFPDPGAPAVYVGSRVLLAIALPLACLLLAPVLTATLPYDEILTMAALVGVGGYVAPAMYVRNRVNTRQRLVREGFPDALDMLVVCVEAGLGVDAAIVKIGEEISRSQPLLAEHFKLMGLELRAGKGRDDALRNFSARIGIDEVSALVSLLIQTDRLGTSMSQALKAYSEDMRAKRMLRAEEKAQKLGVKMSLPLITFILPALFIVIISPAIIRAIELALPLFLDGGSR